MRFYSKSVLITTIILLNLNLAHAKLAVFGAGHAQESYKLTEDLENVNRNVVLIDKLDTANPDFILDVSGKSFLDNVGEIKDFYHTNLGEPDDLDITNVVFEQLPSIAFSSNTIINALSLSNDENISSISLNVPLGFVESNKPLSDSAHKINDTWVSFYEETGDDWFKHTFRRYNPEAGSEYSILSRKDVTDKDLKAATEYFFYDLLYLDRSCEIDTIDYNKAEHFLKYWASSKKPSNIYDDNKLVIIKC